MNLQPRALAAASYRQFSAIQGVGLTCMYSLLQTELTGHSPRVASSSMSGFPVKATIFASSGRRGAWKKFNGQRGISECLKLRHQFSEKKSS